MKTKMLLIVVGVLSTFATAYSIEVSAKAFCSNATLKGTYTYFGQGVRKPYEIYLETGMETYDGEGYLVNVYTSSDTLAAARDTGTYSVGDDCQGTVIYASGAVYNIYVDPTGNGFTYIQTVSDDNKVLSGEEKRISKQMIFK